MLAKKNEERGQYEMLLLQQSPVLRKRVRSICMMAWRSMAGIVLQRRLDIAVKCLSVSM